MKKYEQVKRYIVNGISSGKYVAGERIDTEEELGRILSVSHITVKKALSDLVEQNYIYRIKGKGTFVKEHAKEMMKRSRTFALLISNDEVKNSAFMRLVSGIQKEMTNSGDILAIEYADGTMENERAVLENTMRKDIDGLLLYIFNVQLIVEILHNPLSKKIPYVVLDRCDERYPCNLVAPNNTDGVFAAVDYLIQNGHSRIGFVGKNPSLSSERERYAGYLSALRFASLPVDERLVFREYRYDDMRLCERIREGEMTALFAVHDRCALTLLDIFQKEGIEVPEQISIIGFDDYGPAAYAHVPLTTIRQDFETLGREAARLLFDIYEKKQQSGYKRIYLPTLLVERDSVKKRKVYGEL